MILPRCMILHPADAERIEAAGLLLPPPPPSNPPAIDFSDAALGWGRTDG